ncbi:MAG: hypothetical protein ABMA13_14235 [Chthoniobacteraceae bacterium]
MSPTGFVNSFIHRARARRAPATVLRAAALFAVEIDPANRNRGFERIA